MPQLKELSLCFTASPHRSRCHLSRGAAHPSTQLAKTAWWGNAVLHGGEPRGPRRVGCQRIISQARDVPPQVSAQQTMQPIRLTPSDHSGCNPEPSVLLPDPSVDSQGWCREWVHKQKSWDSATDNTCAHWHFQNWISPKNINPSDLDYNADSDLSKDIYCKISENRFQATRSHLEDLNHMNSDNNDMWNPDTLFIDAMHNDSNIMWQ